MNNKLDTPEKKLVYLKEVFQKDLPNKLKKALIETEKFLKTPNESQHQSLKRTLHTLAGSTGVFGFMSLSEALRAIEYRLPDFDVTRLESIDEVKTSLQELITEYQSSNNVKAPATHLAINNSDHKAIFSDEPIKAKINILQLIVLHGFDPDEGAWLKSQIESYGLNVKCINQLNHLESFDKYHQNTILIVRLSHKTFNLRKQELVEFKDRSIFKVHTIILSDISDFQTRYEVASLGCEYFHTIPPLNIAALVNSIEECSNIQSHNSQRVIAIDDDPDIIAYLTLLFNENGFEFLGCSNPEMMTDMLAEQTPDLILMDLYISEYRGEYLVSLIRQFPQWSSIPILYLSKEFEANKIHYAMLKGADDYIAKPFDDNELIFKARNKIRRHQLLNKLISLDSLTGLLKQSVIKQTLESELERAQRLSYSISVAMIDIDYFKNINDTYGHTTGDYILSTLSSFLKQRFRKCDFIGRYGGEEFMVVLPNCTLNDAFTILENLRKDFAKLEFSSKNQHFFSSLSAGIACTTGNQKDAALLIETADKHLYEAKKAGRNKVYPPMDFLSLAQV